MVDVFDLELETFGWREIERSRYHLRWRSGLDRLTLEASPVTPVIGSGETLREWLDHWAIEMDAHSGRRVDGARWLIAPSGLRVAEVQLTSSRGAELFDHWGELIVPAIDGSWRVELLCPDREYEPDGSGSRRRQELLAILVESVRVRPGRTLEPTTPGVPPTGSLADALERHRHILEQTYLFCAALPNPSRRTDIEAVCDVLEGVWLPSISDDDPTGSTLITATPAGLAPIPNRDAVEFISTIIWSELVDQAEVVGLAARQATVEVADAIRRELVSPSWYANFDSDGTRLAGNISSGPWGLFACGADQAKVVVLLHEDHR